MKLLFTSIIVLLVLSCGQSQNTPHDQAGIHNITVEEVLQTKSYTYVLGKENDKLQWLAMPRTEASVGETFYYEGSMEMKNFKSKELDREFESVLFLEGISKRGSAGVSKGAGSESSGINQSTPSANISRVEGAITIAELFENKKNYADKIVKVTGEVTKFSADIMNTNWIHLQDGTEYNGENDLTITADIKTTMGDIVTIEGKIILDKDFGYGYFYKVIMTEATIVK